MLKIIKGHKALADNPETQETLETLETLEPLEPLELRVLRVQILWMGSLLQRKDRRMLPF